MKNRKLIFKVCRYGISFLLLFALSAVIINAEPSTEGIFAPINKLKEIVTGLITAVGSIFVLYGIFNCALSFQSHDPSQRSSGILSIITGVIMVVGPLILDFLI